MSWPHDDNNMQFICPCCPRFPSRFPRYHAAMTRIVLRTRKQIESDRWRYLNVFCDGQVEMDALQRSLTVRIEQLGRQGAPTAQELPAALPLPASSLPGTAQPTTFTIVAIFTNHLCRACAQATREKGPHSLEHCPLSLGQPHQQPVTRLLRCVTAVIGRAEEPSDSRCKPPRAAASRQARRCQQLTAGRRRCPRQHLGTPS